MDRAITDQVRTFPKLALLLFNLGLSSAFAADPPKPVEFPPLDSARRVGGELVSADFIHRSGQFRSAKGELVDFTLPPFASVKHLNAEADLRDVPLGALFQFFLNPDARLLSGMAMNAYQDGEEHSSLQPDAGCGRVVDEALQSHTQSVGTCSRNACDEVPTPVGLQAQPRSTHRIEVRGVASRNFGSKCCQPSRADLCHEALSRMRISLSPSLLGTTMKEAQPAMAEKLTRIFD